MRHIWLALPMLIGIVAIGCTSSSTSASLTPTVNVFLPEQLRAFPQQDLVEGERARLTAAASGQLLLVDGCLRLVEQPWTDHLLIWPGDHTVKDEEGVLVVYDSTGQRIAQVGDWIWMGGGEISRTEPITGTVFGLQEPTPPECPGPYWVMGNIEANNGPTPWSTPPLPPTRLP